MRKARRLGLDPPKFATYAFVLLLLFIFPGMYLNDALSGVRPAEPRRDSRTDRIVAYLLPFLYACWLLGPIAVFGFLLMATTVTPFTPADEQITEPIFAVVLAVMLLA